MTPEPSRFASAPVLWLLGLTLVMAVLCYFPGLNGPFAFDDEPNITKNQAIQISHPTLETLETAALSYGSGIFRRPLSMLTIALNYSLAGLDPFPYKVTNLAIHLTNGVLLFALVCLLTQAPLVASRMGANPKRSEWIALLVSTAWLLHPINLTGVLYVIQRMTSLSALFCLSGMLLYTWGRLRLSRHEHGGVALILSAILIATPLAMLSKETGILLPGFLFLIEWLLFGFGMPRTRIRRGLIALFILIVGIPAICAASFLLTHPTWISGGYVNRPFTLEERILTEPRVLWLYLRLLVLPRPSALSLFHDDLPLSTGLIQPWTTLPAILGLFALAFTALLARRPWPLASFGILLFLGGHILESSVFALEIVHEHRNYLPGMGILLALTSLMMSRHDNIRLSIGIMVLLTLLYGSITAMRANVWSDPYRLALTGVSDHTNSSRWHYEMGQMLFAMHTSAKHPEERAELYLRSRKQRLIAAELDPYVAPGDLLSVMQIDSLTGLPPDPAVTKTLLERLPQGPIAAFSVSAFISLMECLSQSYCSQPIEDIDRLLTALLSNPNLGGKNRGQLLAAAAQYAIKRRDIHQTLAYTEAAIAADPSELQHLLNHVQALIYAGRMEEARTLLSRAREESDRNAYRSRIEQIEDQLSN